MNLVLATVESQFLSSTPRINSVTARDPMTASRILSAQLAVESLPQLNPYRSILRDANASLHSMFPLTALSNLASALKSNNALIPLL